MQSSLDKFGTARIWFGTAELQPLVKCSWKDLKNNFMCNTSYSMTNGAQKVRLYKERESSLPLPNYALS